LKQQGYADKVSIIYNAASRKSRQQPNKACERNTCANQLFGLLRTRCDQRLRVERNAWFECYEVDIAIFLNDKLLMAINLLDVSADAARDMYWQEKQEYLKHKDGCILKIFDLSNWRTTAEKQNLVEQFANTVKDLLAEQVTVPTSSLLAKNTNKH
jgi:hypothetical protein